jgi:hypothetical protein
VQTDLNLPDGVGPTRNDGPRPYHVLGVNHCAPGDRLITVAQSMGNLAVAFLLENAHSDDPNYEFLRTGGLDGARAPYFELNRVYPEHPFGRHVRNRFDEDMDGEFGAAFWNFNGWDADRYLAPASRVVTPTRDSTLGVRRWIDIARPSEGTSPPLQEGWYPPIDLMDEIAEYRRDHFRLVPSTDRRARMRVPADAMHPEEADVFPYVEESRDRRLRRARPARRIDDPGAILGRIAYHYSIAGPYGGSNAADCGCVSDEFGGNFDPEPHAAPSRANRSMCALLREGIYLVDQMTEPRERWPRPYPSGNAGLVDSALCNMAAFSLQTGSSTVVSSMGGQPSRRMFLFAGSDPHFGGTVRAVDATFSSPRVEPPISDQIVPIGSALACRVDLWTDAASMDPRGVATPGFGAGVCGAHEHVWMTLPGDLGPAVNDFLGAFVHINGQHQGIDRRTAYALDDGFWNTVRHPMRGTFYVPGEPLLFAIPGSAPRGAQCFRLPRIGEYPGDFAAVSILFGGTRRWDFLGMEPECLEERGMVMLRRHRTIAHILGIEENYTRRTRHRGPDGELR